ncbi:hypothetical protein Bhyg_04887 [Pseudolycoriella hygida]|uniref:Uncharacterized protein n=1 Tax=Pseudolycoriella hygida TaxID=35572 RepID=A0A9Q0NG70_9DIPT|nr:hypothetical protein Bhyg_04887 [Pseudolycoriella hygida]
MEERLTTIRAKKPWQFEATTVSQEFNPKDSNLAFVEYVFLFFKAMIVCGMHLIYTKNIIKIVNTVRLLYEKLSVQLVECRQFLQRNQLFALPLACEELKLHSGFIAKKPPRASTYFDVASRCKPSTASIVVLSFQIELFSIQLYEAEEFKLKQTFKISKELLATNVLKSRACIFCPLILFKMRLFGAKIDGTNILTYFMNFASTLGVSTWLEFSAIPSAIYVPGYGIRKALICSKVELMSFLIWCISGGRHKRADGKYRCTIFDAAVMVVESLRVQYNDSHFVSVAVVMGKDVGVHPDSSRLSLLTTAPSEAVQLFINSILTHPIV